jgi:hypothetical protein
MTKQQQQQQPITPPHELIEEWIEQFKGDHPVYIAIQAAQWGADQELEACCEWLVTHKWHGPSGACLVNLRADRRPKPLSLKEQALAVLEEEPKYAKELIGFDTDQVNLIRRALEALPE